MNKYQTYRELEEKITLLAEEQKNIKQEILDELIKQNKKTEETEWGKFTRVDKKNWTYSEGVAKFETVYSINFTK